MCKTLIFDDGKSMNDMILNFIANVSFFWHKPVLKKMNSISVEMWLSDLSETLNMFFSRGNIYDWLYLHNVACFFLGYPIFYDIFLQ